MPRVACPTCSALLEVADDLATDARVRCDGCGKRFAPTSAPSEDAPLDLDECEEETPAARRSRVFLLAACIGSSLLLAGLAVEWLASRPTKRDERPVAAAPAAEPPPPPKKNPDPPDPARPRVPPGEGERLAADTLTRLYSGDIAGADVRYAGATLTVGGKLTGDAVRRADGGVAFGLAGSGDARVWCRLGPEANTARLPAGVEVTVRGKCLGSGLRFGAANGFREAADVILGDCVLVGEPGAPPTLPTPAGVDYPEGIEHHGVAVRVTAIHVGRPVMVLGPTGPNPGATARTRDKYLVCRLEVRNKRQSMYSYRHPGSEELWLRDERGTRFPYERFEVPAAAGTVVANELAATPARRWRFEGESAEGPLEERQTATYFLIFEARHLCEGKKLFLTLPSAVFGLRVVDQTIRFDQSVVEPLPESAAPDLTPTVALAIEAATATVRAAETAGVNSQVAELVTQLAKGKVQADRVRAADDLRRMGRRAKGATAALCNALFDPATPVKLAALDALKAVNPPVYGPVATLVAPLTEADLLFIGSSGRAEAVAALAKLGADGRAAVPILLWYKPQISKPGGWPQVPEVLDALAALAPDEPAVAALLVQSLSKDGYGAARLSAARGLAGVKPTKEAVAALTTAVRGDPEPDVRLAAVKTLGKFGAEAKAALKVLEGARSDPDQRVREAARDALDKIK